MGIFLEILTPDGLFLKEEVELVEAKSPLGEFGILPGHVKFLALLDIGEIRYLKDGRMNYIAAGEGILEVIEDHVTCLLDWVLKKEQIDLERAKREKEEEEGILKDLSFDDPSFKTHAKALKKALTMISVSERE